MATKQPAEGFQPHFRKSRVTEPWEPLYSKRAAGTLQIGLWLSEAHCNSRGFVHGGVIASLADNAMGLSCIYALQESSPGLFDETSTPPQAVTLNLNMDYVSSARSGQWLQIEPRVIRVGRSIGFVDSLVTADADIVAKGSAVFKLISGAG